MKAFSNPPETVVSSRDVGTALSADLRWQLAQRIAASDIFSKSQFLPKFLLHICELHLREKDDELREQKIGVRVFGRPPGYNPGDDNIVRNYAVQLRKRLNLYFEREGIREEIRIQIPRGGYVPVFHVPHEAQRLSTESLVTASDGAPPLTKQSGASQSDAPRQSLHWLSFLAGIFAGALLLAAGLLVLRRQPVPTVAATSRHPLWSAIFEKNRDTLIVPADSAVGILQNITGTQASLASYSTGEYLSDVKVGGLSSGSADDLRTQRYTSMVDLNITARLSHLSEVVPDHLIVRYARDLRMDDLRNNNVILLGAIHTDPWINLLQRNLNFQFVCGKLANECYIANTHPVAGEPASYRSDLSSPYRQTYSVVALLPNLDRTGWILLIEGLNMAGTEAAANMLLDGATIPPVLRKAFAPQGSPRGFELLIQTGSLEAEALPAKIVAQRLNE